jgi:hypothetical protein
MGFVGFKKCAITRNGFALGRGRCYSLFLTGLCVRKKNAFAEWSVSVPKRNGMNEQVKRGEYLVECYFGNVNKKGQGMRISP